MRIIRTVEIKYFRSIYSTKLKSCEDMNVISGRNDVGKSNVLRALNLFFNERTDWAAPLAFEHDFSLQRLDQVRKESIKGKQFIQVAIEFLRPKNYKGSLPERFTVKRTWHRDQSLYTQSDNLQSLFNQGKCPSSLASAQRMLPKFLNRIHFEYVPAVKDRIFFDHLLGRLQSSLLRGALDEANPITDVVENLADHIGTQVAGLRDDFSRATGLGTSIQPPEELASLFQAFRVAVPTGDEGEEQIPLTLRGDGMQARYIPSVLHYIAQKSSSFFIWGFEEPENSLEYANADSLANDLQEIYSEEAQVFLTSHSPAFVSRHGDGLSCYRVVQDDARTTAHLVPLPLSATTGGNELSEEIGLLRIQQEIHQEYVEKLEALELVRERVAELETELAEHAKPLILVEGGSDVHILTAAWSALYAQTMPFVVRSADPLANIPGSSSGGAGAVAKAIESIHPEDGRHVLALFDHDQEGCETFRRLSKNFNIIGGNEWLKRHKNGFARATTLAIIGEENNYASRDNLCIEFFFDDEHLVQESAAGHGLVLEQPPVKVGIGQAHHDVNAADVAVIDDLFGDLRYYRRIKSGKTVFAEEIVPTFDATAFTAFEALFDSILAELDVEVGD